jgi:hypothetical protein
VMTIGWYGAGGDGRSDTPSLMHCTTTAAKRVEAIRTAHLAV